MSLDLGALVGEVRLDATLFETTYVRVVRQMADLGGHAEGAAAGTSMLDRALVEAGVSARIAADGLAVTTRAEVAQASAAVRAGEAESARAMKVTASAAALLREVDATDRATVATGRQAASTSDAALAASRLTQATLRQQIAQDRLTALQASGTASARQLAAAEASLAAANDRVALSQDRVDRAMALGARTTDRAYTMWAAIPGPVKAVAAALTAVAVLSVHAAVKFQDTTTRIRTQADATTQQVAVLRAGILGMAAAVATAPDVLALAAYHIASVGQKSLTTAQELDILKVAAEGAKLGHANLVDVTNALDAAIVAHMRGVRDYTQVMGVMNATVGAGDMTMQDFADAFGPLGSTFKGFNVSIQQAGAALATFGDNNLRGADAGTQLRMSITALADPLKAGRDQLKQWGLTSGDLSKQLAHGGLTEALTTLAALMHRNGITAETMGPKLAEMFGKRGPQQGLSTLINQLDRYESKLREVTAGGESFARRWSDYAHTAAYAWDRIKAGAEAAAISIGNRLLPEATRALSWIGTTGIDDIGKFWHALSTNPQVVAGLHEVVSAVGHVLDAVHNTADAAAPLARVLLTVGGGAVVLDFRVLATVLNGVAAALDDVTGFFAHNHAAAEALAFILATALVPAALATGRALLWTGLETTAAGIGRMFTSTAALSAGLRSLNLSALAARAGVVLLAIEVFNAVGDFTHLNDSADKLRSALGKPIKGNVFQTLADDSAKATASLSANVVNSLGAWGSLKTGFFHPIKAIGLLAGAGDDALNKSQAQISAALGNIHDLQHALYGLNAAPIDAQAKINAVIGAMGLSVKDLSTKDFPGLLSQVRAWQAANQAANAPAAQAAKDILALGTGAQTAAQDVASLKDALDQLAGKALTADEAAITFRNDIAHLDTAVKASGGSLSLGTQPGRDARQALDTAARSALDLATALKDSGKSTTTVRASLQASIAMLKAHGGASTYAKQAIAELQAALNALPSAAVRSAAGMQATAPRFAAAGNAMSASLQAAFNAAKFRQAGFTVGTSLADGITLGIQQRSGATLLVSEKLVNGVLTVMRNKAEAKSPSQATIRLGRDIADGLPIGYLARQPQVLAAFTQGTTATLYAVTQAVRGMLTAANSKLSADMQARTSTAQQITSGITGNYALSGAIGPAGNVGNLSAYFGGGAHTLARELTLLGQLKGKHVAPGLIAEIAGLAPMQAIAAATSILGGQSGKIANLDRQYAAIASYAGKIGNEVASAQFDQMIAHDKQALLEAREANSLLRQLLAEYRKQPKAFAAALDTAIRTGGAHR